MVGAGNSVGENAQHALAPGPGHSVIAVDEVVSPWRNLREDHGTRQVCSGNGQLTQSWAGAAVGNVVERDGLRTESTRSDNVGREPGNVELENPIGIELIASHCFAGLKGRVEIEPQRRGIRAG